MSGRLQGKYAAITGGAGGIGRAMAAGYIAEGATVCIADRSLEAAAAAARELGPQAHACALDVAEMASIAAFADFTAARGGLDILVNNAAVFDLAPIADITEASYDRLFAVNVKGLLFTLQAVARQMIANGRRGRIINMASQAGRRGEALVGVYCATKAAVISLTQSAGLDLIRHGIRVNAISPGVVDTPMWQEVDVLFAKYESLPVGEKKRQVGLAVPYGRMGRPDDLVGAAIFLASDEAEYVVAQTLNVDGGNCMN
ncbi:MULTISPECIES: L-iditol 2-dehydrogenase [unclassified Acidiphilium]|uniref:L-iditol 2-dehydrogenase n=1 Tax=unclassified Acidiphilium TaxID=2617493 RepID=UPI0002145AF1|nr:MULTISPECIES: L-iditol 2-dehydrogenase [unclassified Acidiphilium]EGO94038.1 Short-chain dehydrogenase/reductase SDR [Acidiphilium sp. PM]